MTVVDAWQAVLAREYAALYGYGIVGARLGSEEQGADGKIGVRAVMQAHATVRDRAIAALESLGATPVPAAAAYTTASSPKTRTPRQLAAAIEADCAFAYLELIGADELPGDEQSRTKQIASRWLQDAAQRQWEWSSEIPAWPGFS